MSLCYNCFKEMGETTICPHCGYDATVDSAKYPLALPHGTVLGGRYITGRVLGQGGFGITYVAQEYTDKRLVAIKEYFPDTLAIRQHGTTVSTINGEREENYRYGMECFLSEAKTLAEFIGNPNIVRIYSYFEENDTAYFAMEYIEGTPLIDYVKSRGGKIPYEEALNYILPVMDALSAIHAKGIIHRDISPDNIIITHDGSVKLIDFGAARYSMGDRSRSLDVVLKHGFAPMEQYTRRGRQGAYTDVYSLAATLYRCITGRVPPDSVDRIAEDALVPPSGFGVQIPPHAEDALLTAMEVMTANRYQTMAQFKAALTGEAGAAVPQAAYPQQSYQPQAQPVTSYEPRSVQNYAQSQPVQSYAQQPAPVYQAPVSQVQTGNYSTSSPGTKKKKTGLIAGISAAAAVVIAAVVLLIVLLPKRGEDTTSTSAPDDTGTNLSNYSEGEEHLNSQNPYVITPTEAVDDSLPINGIILSASYYHSVGVKSDGTVIAIGSNDEGQCDVSGWTNIASIATGDYHTVGLKKDGTVVAVGNNEYGQCDVESWEDIIDISAGEQFTVGLKKDGTVVAVGGNDHGECDVSSWTDIVAIESGRRHTVGLKADGTVVATGSNDYKQIEVGQFRNVAAIATGYADTFAILTDGTVLAANDDPDDMYQVSDWSNIVAMDVGMYHTVGLKSDGTVIAIGENDDGQCNVSGWKNIVAISVGSYYTLGLKADGTVVATGKNDEGQCSVSRWNLN